jgi:hypothetical protein
MVQTANSTPEINAVASKTVGWSTCFLLAWALSTSAASSNFDSQADQIAKDVIGQNKSFLSQGLGNRLPPANSWDKCSKLVFGRRPLEARLPAGTMIPRSACIGEI